MKQNVLHVFMSGHHFGTFFRILILFMDCDALQKDMETIYKWAEEVNMVFNSDKFECLRFWPGRMEVPIETKEHLRDLGVELSNDLCLSSPS